MITDPWQKLREALQYLLDAEGDHWMVSHWVAVLGIERVGGGDIKTSVWMAMPPSQPDYVTDGLLKAAEELREHADLEDD